MSAASLPQIQTGKTRHGKSVFQYTDRAMLRSGELHNSVTLFAEDEMNKPKGKAVIYWAATGDAEMRSRIPSTDCP